MHREWAEAIRAPLRWAGSKRKSIPALSRYLPEGLKHYIEPFAGSACIAFFSRPKTVVLGDINPQLIEFYNCLRDHPTELYEGYRSLPRNESEYYKIRLSYNESVSGIDRASKFLYLNRYCFNGIYRVNTAGNFNVPWGGDKVGKALSLVDLVEASNAMADAQFVCGDFEKVVFEHLKEGSFVYLDPPYASDESRVFREYNENSFGIADWARLIDVLKEIDKRGAYFLMSYAGPSNLDSDLAHWNAGYLDVTRNVGGFKSTRRKYREFVATNCLPNL